MGCISSNTPLPEAPERHLCVQLNSAVDAERSDARHNNLDRKRKRDETAAQESSYAKNLRRYKAFRLSQSLRNTRARLSNAVGDTDLQEPGNVSPICKISHDCISDSSESCSPILNVGGEGDEINDDEDDKSMESDNSDAKGPQPPNYVQHPGRVPGAKALEQAIDRAVNTFYGNWEPRLPKYHVEVEVKLTERCAWTWKDHGKTMLRLNIRRSN